MPSPYHYLNKESRVCIRVSSIPAPTDRHVMHPSIAKVRHGRVVHLWGIKHFTRIGTPVVRGCDPRWYVVHWSPTVTTTATIGHVASTGLVELVSSGHWIREVVRLVRETISIPMLEDSVSLHVTTTTPTSSPRRPLCLSVVGKLDH